MLTIPSKFTQLILQDSIETIEVWHEKEFLFLNLKYKFEEKIDWNYAEYGKLWTYNLTYFDVLNQKNIHKEEGLNLIHDFVDQAKKIQDGFEPFPISLRGINWIKFLIKHQMNNEKISDSLYAQYYILLDNLEYHLLGNHLLENGFSLLFGAYYFRDEKLYKKAKKILENELEEQILQDGAHFELSPMYHQLMLFRILDCINLVQNNNWKNKEILPLLLNKAETMLGWINEITFDNGHIPLFNDSTNKVAPTTAELNKYAIRLGLTAKKIKLMSSGYRKVRTDKYEMVIDVGNIGPDYIPGHAHSDTFNFELYIHNKPVIVDTGLSTYEINERRQLERATKSHNTVVVNENNQSEAWGGFRVARRAKIIHLDEQEGKINATHDGYKKKEIFHTREFITEDHYINIYDIVDSKSDCKCVAYLHFHPDVDVILKNNVLISNYFMIHSTSKIELDEYYYSPEFNTEIKAQLAKIYFSKVLETNIIIKEIHENN